MSGSCWLGVMESISLEGQDSQSNVFKKINLIFPLSVEPRAWYTVYH